MLSGVNPDSLTAEQKQKSLRGVNIIKLKRSGKLKVRMCANGEPQYIFLPVEEAKLMEITLEGLLATMVIDAYEDRKLENFDILGVYLQSDLPKYNFAILLLEEKFVDITCDINPKYNQHVRFKDGSKTLYLRILKEIYGIIESDLMWYELYMSVLNYMGFQLNPYRMCVENKDINKKQCTIAAMWMIIRSHIWNSTLLMVSSARWKKFSWY